MPKRSLLLLGLAIICLGGRAQNTAAENSFTQTAIDSAIAAYHQFTGKRSRLLNGLEYFGYSKQIEGHACFLSDQWQKGTLIYDGIFYAEVPMVYDLYKDQLIILHPDRYPAMSLFGEKVTEFTLSQHHFIRIEHDSLSQSRLPTGFYDELYQGKLLVLARRIKLLDERITDKVEREFLPKDFYYIRKEGVFYAVKSYNDLLFVLKDQAKEIRQYLKRNKIKYRKQRENAIVKAVAFYDAHK